jgi:hypothetical protein
MREERQFSTDFPGPMSDWVVNDVDESAHVPPKNKPSHPFKSRIRILSFTKF